MEQEIYLIKQNVIDKIILVVLISTAFPYIASLTRASEFGWQTIYTIQSCIQIVPLLLYLYRKKLSLLVKTYALSVFFSVIGVIAIWFLGFNSAHFYVIMAIALTVVFINRTVGLVFTGLILLSYISIGTLYVFGDKQEITNPETIAHSPLHWLTIILSLIAFGAVFIVGFSQLFNNLIQSIKENGRIRKLLKSQNDDLQAAKEKLNTTIGELKEINSTKDKLFSIIAHDLRNPFNSISGFSNLMLDNFDKYSDEEKKRFLSLMNESIAITQELLDDLLLWARMQRDNIKFTPKPENLFLLVTKVSDSLKQNIDKKKLHLFIDIDPVLTIMTDSFILSTVIRNLLSNAIKFSHAGTGLISISAKTIGNGTKQGSVELRITDNGIGIPEQIQQNLFDVTESGSVQGTENEKGTGLGLPICYELIKKHDSKLNFESTPGVGTSFFFILPKS